MFYVWIAAAFAAGMLLSIIPIALQLKGTLELIKNRSAEDRLSGAVELLHGIYWLLWIAVGFLAAILAALIVPR
ncbi:hypothetical protein NO932_11590 [Pelagibacterium sp. 26DY04]|uniref:hypothetical protein n=1 Tax=Pelagibacterium sp. 26DY04 TaxID=2967130 RepID=UPI00281513A6|nr:hypothetical protein [Pelagibacterium sp. 26DY04]WMT85570.1 hypothetical protein NO932_11590 [Pelagibacterium sp. 26DY04]